MQKTIGIVMVCLLVAVAAVAQMPPGPRGGGEGPERFQHQKPDWWKSPELQKRLDLRPEQIEMLENRSFESAKQMIEFKSRFQIAKMELGRLLDAPEVDREAIQGHIGHIGKLVEERLTLQIEQHLATREILSPEQYENLNAIRHRVRQKMMERRWPHHGDEDEGEGKGNRPRGPQGPDRGQRMGQMGGGMMPGMMPPPPDERGRHPRQRPVGPPPGPESGDFFEELMEDVVSPNFQ